MNQTNKEHLIRLIDGAVLLFLGGVCLAVLLVIAIAVYQNPFTAGGATAVTVVFCAVAYLVGSALEYLDSGFI